MRGEALSDCSPILISGAYNLTKSIKSLIIEMLFIVLSIVKFTFGIVSVSWSCLPVRAIAIARLANAGLRQQIFTVTNARLALAR